MNDIYIYILDILHRGRVLLKMNIFQNISKFIKISNTLIFQYLIVQFKI